MVSLPNDLVANITIALLQRIDQAELNQAINGVRHRLLDLGKSPAGTVAGAQALDDDDYEPDYEPAEDSEQIINGMDGLPRENVSSPPTKLALAPFRLPPPPPLTKEEAGYLGKGTISRIVSLITSITEPSRVSGSGLNRIAANSHSKDAWITLLTRLATRATPEIEDAGSETDANGVIERDGAVAGSQDSSMADSIRETLWKYVVEDFRLRIPIATAWLTEEWYNEMVQSKAERPSAQAPQTYRKWLLKLLDAIIPYLDAKDRILIKFLSEIPAIHKDVLDRVRDLARDPDRVSLAVQTLL